MLVSVQLSFLFLSRLLKQTLEKISEIKTVRDGSMLFCIAIITCSL